MRPLLFFLLLTSICQAQIQKIYTKGTGAKVIKTNSGYYICGDMETNSSDRTGLIFTDTSGAILWQKTYRDQIEFYSYAFDMLRNADGTLIICGMTFNDTTSNEEIELMKTDSAGNLLWVRRIGNQLQDDEMYTILPDTDGGFFLAGSAINFNFRENDFYLIKTDSLGIVQWERTYGSNYDESCSKAIRRNNTLVLAGNSFDTITNEFDMALITVDLSGNLLSAETYPISGFESIEDLLLTPDDELVIVANANGTTTNFEDNTLVAKIDGSGNVLWATTIYGTDNASYSADLDSLGNIIVAGSTKLLNVDLNSFYFAFDKDGNFIAQAITGSNTGGKITDIHYTAPGDFYFTGNHVPYSSINNYVSFGKINFLDSLCLIQLPVLNNRNEILNSVPASFQTYNDTIEEANSFVFGTNAVFTDSSLCALWDDVNELSASSIQLSPNPADHRVQIKLPNGTDNALLKLIDVSGKQLCILQKENDTFTLEVKDLPNGVYCIVIEAGSKRWLKKLIVQHF
jgi:hypothetical protein